MGRFWEENIEPAMPEFDASLFMPELNKIKGVTDRMKNINKYIIVRECKLQLRAKSATMKNGSSGGHGLAEPARKVANKTPDVRLYFLSEKSFRFKSAPIRSTKLPMPFS